MQFTLNYYQALRGGDTKQRREFSVFWDNNLDQETETLTQMVVVLFGLIL